jgi:glycosyltransferase involved in cell wall biosynthesis
MWMERQLFSRANKVIALTEQGRAEILSYGFKGPVVVVPNGVDTRNFVPVHGDVQSRSMCCLPGALRGAKAAAQWCSCASRCSARALTCASA